MVNASRRTLAASVQSLRDGRWVSAAETWETVFGGATAAGPFLSPAWTQSWVETFGADLAPNLLAMREPGGELVGVCLLTTTTDRRAGIPYRCLHLNADGEPEVDAVVMEHNGVVALPEWETPVIDCVAEYAESSGVAELRCAGLDAPWVELLLRRLPHWRPHVEWRDSPFVDLGALRQRGHDHWDVLGRNTRAQLRRALSAYEQRGALRLEVAQTHAEADAMLSELITLHDARWATRGHTGAFSTPRRLQFHRRVVQHGVRGGTAYLMRIVAGDQTVGVLYTTHAHGRVNFYQSGFRYEQDNRFRPGFVSHHLAIQHCLQHGMSEYDFLISAPGEGRYKSSLSNATRSLGWVRLFSPGIRGRFFQCVRAARRCVRSFSSAGR